MQQHLAGVASETYISLGGPIRRFGQSRSFARGPAQGFSAAAASRRRRRSAAGSDRQRAGRRGRGAASRPSLARSLSRYPGPLLWSAQAMADLPENFQTAPLAEVDPEIATVLERELHRQQRTLEMIASENFVPQAVLDAAGSVLTNKYAEGYPGRRYYGGCEEVDVAEQLAIDRAKALFGADHANVQPHAGAQANNAVYFGLLRAGRHDPRPRPRPRRPPQPRDENQRLGQVLQPGRLPRAPRGLLGRHGRGRAPRRRAQAEDDRRRLERLPAAARLPRLPRDRRLGRRPADGRHGPLRRARRRQRAPQPGALRRRRHHHRPQDARRARAAASSSAKRSTRKLSTKRSSRASRAAR